MALSLFSKGSKVINLIFNDHSIRYVELKQLEPPVPLRWGERRLQPGLIVDGKIADFETLSMILDECIEEWKIKKREVRFIVPDSVVIIRKLSIPADVEQDEINGYLYLEIGSTIHLPFEEAVFDTILLEESDEKKEIVLFAAPEKFVLDYSDLVQSVKLKPIAADISPLANYRLYHATAKTKTSENLIMLHFDLHLVSMCIFEATVPLFLRYTSVEMDNDWELSVGEAKRVEELNFHYEDVYREISKLMDFYRYSFTQGAKEVTRIVVNGDHPMLPVILKEMRDRFDIPVEEIILEEMPGQKSEAFPRSHYLGLGLGLKEV